MKTKLLTAFLFLIVTSTQVLAARPSLSGLQQQIDEVDQRVTDLHEVCPPGAPTRFVDNGDGTICDHETGLMWEKKDASDGTPDFANPHDVDNYYTWSSAADGDTTNPDGTAYTDFLLRLNSATDNPSMVGFAGYSDWRLPTIVELQTLLFEPYPCLYSPCIIDPIFAPTAATGYWSSTSNTSNPGMAWGVNFFNGFLIIDGKSYDRRVRCAAAGNYWLV